METGIERRGQSYLVCVLHLTKRKHPITSFSFCAHVFSYFYSFSRLLFLTPVPASHTVYPFNGGSVLWLSPFTVFSFPWEDLYCCGFNYHLCIKASPLTSLAHIILPNSRPTYPISHLKPVSTSTSQRHFKVNSWVYLNSGCVLFFPHFFISHHHWSRVFKSETLEPSLIASLAHFSPCQSILLIPPL